MSLFSRLVLFFELVEFEVRVDRSDVIVLPVHRAQQISHPLLNPSLGLPGLLNHPLQALLLFFPLLEGVYQIINQIAPQAHKQDTNRAKIGCFGGF